MEKVCFQCDLFSLWKSQDHKENSWGKNCLLTGSADLMAIRGFIGSAKSVLIKDFDAVFH